MSSSVIKSPTPILEKKGFTVFLAGPMKGAPKWQRTVPKIAESIGIDGVTWLNPYRCQRWVTWREQVAWETQGLRVCDLCFGSEDALAARAQFSSVLDMNQTIVERWNRQVGLHDTVWCSGIVGDDSWLRLLNGDIRFGVPSDDSLQINPLILF